MKQTTTPKLLKTFIALVLLALFMVPSQQAAAQCCQNWVYQDGTQNVAIPLNNTFSATTTSGSGSYTYMNFTNGWPYYVQSVGVLAPNLTIMGYPAWSNVSCGTTLPRAWTHVTTVNGANAGLLEVSCNTSCTQWCGTLKSVPSGCCEVAGTSAGLQFRTNFIAPNAISGAETVCYNAAQTSITASGFSGAEAQMSFDWYYVNSTANPSAGGYTFYTTTNGSATMTPPASTVTRSWNCVYYATGNGGSWSAWSTGYVTKTIYGTIVPGTSSGATTVCSGGNAGTYTATASGGNGSYTYDWYYLDNAACPSTGTYVYTGYSQTTGGTSTYSPGVVTSAGGLTRKYQAYVSGCGGLGNGWTSGCGTLTLQSTTNNVGSITAPAVVCPGATFTVSNSVASTTGSPASTGPNYNFYLQKTDAPNLAGWATVSGGLQAASSYTYTMPNAPGTYQVARNSAWGCAGESSAPFLTITVPQTFNAGTTQADQTVCQVSGPAGLTSLSGAVGGNGSYTYGWQSSTNNSTFTDIASTNSTTYTPPSTVGTIYYRRKVSETGGCFTSPIYTGQPQNIAFSQTGTVNCTISGNTITKSTANGWDGGSYSLIPIHKGGYVECKSTQTGTDKMFGLNSDPATDASYCSIDYAAYFNGSQVTCYENCAGAGSITASYVVGDIFRVQWNATTNRIEYLKNGVVTLTSGVVPVATLYADFSLYQTGSSLNSIVVQGDDNSKVVVQPTPGVPTVNGTTSNFAVSFCGSGTLSCVQGWEDQLLGSGPIASTCALYKGAVFQGFGTSFPITTAGTYTVYSYNNNVSTGVPCQGNVGVTVTVTLTPSFTVALTKSNYNGYNVSCSNSSNGTITATPSANVYNMVYQWSNGTTNTVLSPTTNNTISGLSPGTYFVTVGDASGCEASASATISVPPAVTVSLTPGSFGTGFGTNCAGSNTGTISSFPGGGTAAGWSYVWSSTPSGYVNPGTQAIGSLTARTYNVVVTESNGCTASASAALTDPSVITFTTGTGFACSGSTYTDGIVTIVASGGASGTYNYRRNGGAWQSSPIFAGNASGSTSSYQVQDATFTSCLSASSNVTVTYPPNGVAVADCNFIYVSTTGDPTGTLGSKLCPVTLTQAFTIFAGAPARNQILMASGTYTFGATISIPANVTIDGGYDANTWVKSTATPTILNISPAIVDNGTYGTGYYIGMQPAGNGWKLQDLTINAQPGGAVGTYLSKGRSIFGVYINGQTGWTMTRCVVTTGSASAGLAGSGNTGSYSTGGGGGAGGSSGGGCSSCGANGANGTAGSAGAAGGGGGGRCCSGGCNLFGCGSNGCTAGGAAGGANGGNGADGAAGVQSSGLSVFYVPQNGANGGTAGSGGGGGGGGGGAYGTCCSCTCGPYNAQGGAGGQGGYGGAGGLLGYGGGSAVAVYVYGGTGTLLDVNLAPGAAGAGGAGAGGVGGGGTGVYYSGSDNSGWCDGGKGGTGGPGGFGGTGGTGGAGATGYSTTLVQLNGASVGWTGGTVPTDGTVTANWYSGCTNSEIVITKTSGSAWTGISTDPAYELNSTSGATTYGNSSSTAVIYYPASTTVGDKNLSLGSTTLNKFIKIKGNRLITPASSIISALSNPCPLGAISVSHTLSAGQIANTTAYDWKISNVASPTVYVYNSNSPNPAATPATVNPPSGGWVLGATYQIRLQLTEACCGPSIPMYSTFTIPTQLAQVPTITQSPSGTVCSGQQGVTYTATAVAGATGYTWTVTGGGVIQSGQGTATVTVNWGAAINGATVSVIPTNSCTPSTDGPIKTNTFNVNGSPIATITPQSATTFCSGGSVVLLGGASGGGGLGNGAFTYAWAPVSGAGLSSLSGTPVTGTPPSGGVYNYTVVATEGGSGCTASASEVVTMQSVPTAGSISSAQTICYGGDPAAFTSVAGTGYTGTTLTYRWERSVSPFSSWSTVSGNPTTATYDEPNGLLVTTQFRRTTIANLTGVLCESSPTTPIQITVNANLVAGTVGTSQTICNGATPAAFTNITSPTGGTGSYTYQWQSATAFAGPFASIGGASSITYAPGALTATRYYQRLETSGTCGTVSSNVITITVNANLVAGTVAASQTICYNSAPATFTNSSLPTGGDGTYTYQWQSSPDNGVTPFAAISGATGATFSEGILTATTYYRRQETSGSGCGTVNSNVITVTVRPVLVAGTVTASQTICYNAAPATLTNSVFPTGGNGSFTYQWQSSPDNGVTPFANISGATSSSYAPGALTAANYYRRTEIAALGCGTVISNEITITVNPDLVAGSVDASQTICYNATPASLTSTGLPSGGNGSYTYQWQSSLNNVSYGSIAGETNTTYAPGALTATTYFRRQDISGGSCGTVSTNVITITVNPDLTPGVVRGDQTICYNTAPSAFSSLSLPTGGDGTYTYQWQSSPDNGVTPFASISGATSTTYTGGTLTATTYYRRQVTSGSGCGTVNSNVLTVTVRPDLVAGTVAASQTICYNTAPATLTNSVSPSGGSGAFTYQWQSSPDNGVTPFANISGAASLNYTPVALVADNYYRRTEISSAGCGTVISNVITISVNPNLVAGTVAASQTICYNATPAAFTSTGLPTGGNGSYTYQWQSSLNNISYGSIAGETNTTYAPGALTATTYFRRQETSGTCGTVPSNVITIAVPAQVVFTTSLTNVLCNAAGNGTITVNGSGGVSPYTYSKDAGGSYVSGADPYTFTGLVPGTYNIGILDANNCPSSFTAVNITEPAVLSFTESHSPVTCSGGNTGSITVSAAGGTTGYLYSKNNGTSYQVSNVFTTLSVGSYDVVVKDANNCVTAATTVVITGPTPITFTPSVVHVLCNGDNTGSITLSASGGTPGYTYSKDNGSNYQVSNVFASLPQGIYAMKVKDANLCTATTQIVQVTEPTLVTYSTSSTNVVCNGANDGTITIDGNGGVAPYTYSINNGAAFQVGANPFTFSSLTPGTYLAGLKDDNGCVKGFTSISISQPIAVTFSTSKVDVLCFGGNNASITVSASGGTGTLSYSKNNGATYQASNLFSTLIAGTYQIKVKDASGCETVAQSVTITQPAVGLTVTTSNGSPYSTTVVANLFSNPAGGTPTYTYAWSGPYAFSSTLQNPTRSPTVVTMAGTYKVTVTDAHGCSATSQTVMTVYDGYVWKGTVSSDWADNTNWQFQVPDYPDDCTQNAFIQSGTPFSPNVNIPGLTVGNVTLVNGATLNLGNSLTICRTLSGSVSSPYSVINGPGTLIMKSIPSVQEKITNLVKFNATLQIDNSAGVIVNAGNAQIVNALELKSGVLSPAAAGNLTFISNSSTHCAIIDNFSAGMTGSISGSVTMQRKYDAPTAPFYKTQHYVSSPANTLPLSQLGANGTPGYVINTTCNERMSSPGSPYGDVAQYDEDHGAGCTLQGWKILNSGNATNGRGYSMGKNGAGLLTVTGAPNQATSYTRAGLTNSNWSNSTLQGYLDVSGWHMIGNPWLANLRITTNGGVGFDNQVAVWQTTGPFAGAFSYYQVGFDNVDIAPFQGFFVRKSNPGGTATYTINGSDRVRTPSSMPFYSLSLDQQLDVYVEDANGFMDKAVVGFSVDATDTFDAVYDANKIAASGRVLLYSMNNNLPLARNILTSIKTTSTVDLAFDPGNTGSFKMRFDKINTFDPTSYVMLEDKKTNLWYDAKDTSGYLFTADTSDARNRFVLHFTPATEITHTDATCTSQGTINVTQPGTATWTYTVTNSSASVVSTGTLNQATPITLNANPGVYDITLIDNNNYTVVKQVQVTGGQQVQSSFTASDVVVEEGVEITLNSTSTNATGNFWNFGDTDTASGLTVLHTYAAPGTYTVTLTSDNTDCNAVSTQQITVTAKVVSNLNSIADKTGINIWSYGNTVFVDFHKQMKEQATIEIYNVLGQQLSNELSGHSNVYHKTFNNLEASYAIVRVKNNDVITTRKVFIAGK